MADTGQQDNLQQLFSSAVRRGGGALGDLTARMRGGGVSAADMELMKELMYRQRKALRTPLTGTESTSEVKNREEQLKNLSEITVEFGKALKSMRAVAKENDALLADVKRLRKATTLEAMFKPGVGAAFGAAAAGAGGGITSGLGSAGVAMLNYAKRIALENQITGAVPSGAMGRMGLWLGRMMLSPTGAAFGTALGAGAMAAQMYGRMFSNTTGLTPDLINALGINPSDRYHIGLQQRLIGGGSMAFGPSEYRAATRGLLGVRGMVGALEGAEGDEMVKRFAGMGRAYGIGEEAGGRFGGTMMAQFGLKNLSELDKVMASIGSSAKRLGMSFKDMAGDMGAYANALIMTTGRSFADVGNNYIALSNMIAGMPGAPGYAGKAALMGQAIEMGQRVSLPQMAAYNILGGKSGKDFNELLFESAKADPIERLMAQMGAYKGITGGDVGSMRTFAMVQGGASPLLADMLAKASVDPSMWRQMSTEEGRKSVADRYANQMNLSTEAIADLANSMAAQQDPLRLIAKAVERIEYILSSKIVSGIMRLSGGIKLAV